jgi:hypothetical protein
MESIFAVLHLWRIGEFRARRLCKNCDDAAEGNFFAAQVLLSTGFKGT